MNVSVNIHIYFNLIHVHISGASVGCELNHYGKNCQQTCSSRCTSSADKTDKWRCDIVDGSCLHGRKKGWMSNWSFGDHCVVVVRTLFQYM